MPPLKLLQICNVGQITGGTAACAWTVTRALPDMQHSVAFLSALQPETRRAFGNVKLVEWPAVRADLVERLAPDFVVLHNIVRPRCPRRLDRPTLQYLHSRIEPAPADRIVCCSRWLRKMSLFAPRTERHFAQRTPATPDADVLWQAVPRPLREAPRSLDEAPLVGRICTPNRRKWPRELIPFYAELAQRCPQAAWEFVGCPADLQDELRRACRNRARFLDAGWHARRHLCRWDALLYHHPTLTESFGRTVAEAMRAGCIPIVDRRGGFIEQTPPDGGFLCRSLDGFAAALQQLHDPELRRQRAELCQRHAEEYFSLNAFRQRLLALLIEIQASRRA